MFSVGVDEIVKDFDRNIVGRQLGVQDALVAAQPRLRDIALDRCQVGGREGVLEPQVAVGIVAPGILAHLAVAVREEFVDGALHQRLGRADAVGGRFEGEVHVVERAADAFNAAERIAEQTQYFFDFGRAHVRLLAQQVVDMVLIHSQVRLTQPALQRRFVQRQDFGLGEGDSRHKLPGQPLRLPDHALYVFVIAIALLPHVGVHVDGPNAPRDRLKKVEPGRQPVGTLRERALVLRDFADGADRRGVLLAPGVE